jgi:hypothetical protein
VSAPLISTIRIIAAAGEQDSYAIAVAPDSAVEFVLDRGAAGAIRYRFDNATGTIYVEEARPPGVEIVRLDQKVTASKFR